MAPTEYLGKVCIAVVSVMIKICVFIYTYSLCSCRRVTEVDGRGSTRGSQVPSALQSPYPESQSQQHSPDLALAALEPSPPPKVKPAIPTSALGRSLGFADQKSGHTRFEVSHIHTFSYIISLSGAFICIR